MALMMGIVKQIGELDLWIGKDHGYRLIIVNHGNVHGIMAIHHGYGIIDLDRYSKRFMAMLGHGKWKTKCIMM